MNRPTILSLVVISLAAIASPAKAGIIAQWTFESSAPLATNQATIGPIAAEVGSGSAFGVHASANTDYSNPVGNGSGESFSSNEWAAGDYYEFRVSTTGLEDITVSYDQTRSNTGPTTWDFQYSTDGSSFMTFADDYTLDAITFTSVTFNPAVTRSYDLSAITGIDDVATLYFRITAAVAGSGTAGTSRVDNFTVNGEPISATAVPEPSTLVAAGFAVLMGLGVARRRRAG